MCPFSPGTSLFLGLARLLPFWRAPFGKGSTHPAIRPEGPPPEETTEKPQKNGKIHVKRLISANESQEHKFHLPSRPVRRATLEAIAYAVSFAFTPLLTVSPTFPPSLRFRPLETDTKNPLAFRLGETHETRGVLLNDSPDKRLRCGIHRRGMCPSAPNFGRREFDARMFCDCLIQFVRSALPYAVVNLAEFDVVT